MSQSATFIIADDHPLFRSALRAAITQLQPDSVTYETDSLAALIEAVTAHPETDLILLDLRMPGVKGFSSLIQVRAMFPSIPVSVVSAEEEPNVMQRALDFGASGFIPKSAGIEKMGEALNAMLNGAVWLPEGVSQAALDENNDQRELADRISTLTPQQFRVLMMLAEGQLNKQIAGDLNVAEATVKAHVTAILRKLGLYRRTQAAILAQRLLQVEAAPLQYDDGGEGTDE